MKESRVFTTLCVVSLYIAIGGFANAQSHSAVPTYPACLSSASDADGDGYGWENDATCRVTVEGNYPECLYTSSDPDGNGWGWEAGQTCRITNASIPVCESATSDPDNDGWGWENDASCLVVVMPAYPDCSSAAVDSDGDGWGWENDASCVVVTEVVTDQEQVGDTDEEVIPVQDQNIASGILGSWQSECTSYQLLGTSERQVLAIDGDMIAQDFYEYDGPDCSGVPRGTTFPLRLFSYTIGSSVTLDDQSSATELDLQITQLSDVGTLRDGASLGQERFGIVRLSESGELQMDQGSTSVGNRPGAFGSFRTTFSPKISQSTPVNSMADIVGTYRADCHVVSGGSNYQYQIVTETTANTETYYYTNDFCVGEPVIKLQRPISIVPEPAPINTFFGDSAINVFKSRAAQEIVFGEDLVEFDLLTASVRYGLFSLIDGDTLMAGDCVVRESTCKTAPEYFADMIDFEFNSELRFRRVDAVVSSFPGNSNTAAIAGLWDYTDVDSGFYAYQRIESDGSGIYYEVVGGDPNAEGACLVLYNETITFNDGDIYTYQYLPEDPAGGYSFTSEQFVEDGVLVSVDAQSGERSESPALDALPSIAECT